MRLETVVHSGTQADAQARWQAAVEAGDVIKNQQLPYNPSPPTVPGTSNSNSVLNTVVQASTDVTYQNGPAELTAPGSAVSQLTPSEINAIRAANGLPPRDGTEDKIIHERGGFNPDTGQYDEQYTRTNGATGEVKTVTVNASTIDPVTGERATPTGVAEVDRYAYENDPTTPGNPLETRTTLDPLDIRPEVSRTTQYAPDGTPTGVVNDYDDAANWRATRSLNDAHLARFDEAAVNALSQEIERSAFHGGSVPDSTPWVLSYESQFSAGYDFNAGNFDVDAGLPFATYAPDVNLEGTVSGFDNSWLDWNTTGYGTTTWDGGWGVSTFDGWDFGDWLYPIVLDLNNDGVDITSRVDSTVYFDIDGDGFKEQTAWAGASDGLLVIDLAASGLAGADGTITQAKEVSFALQTAALDDTDAEALKTLYDSNGDGKLTAADARFGEFKVWKDANQNGVSEASELQGLAAAGIT